MEENKESKLEPISKELKDLLDRSELSFNKANLNPHITNAEREYQQLLIEWDKLIKILNSK